MASGPSLNLSDFNLSIDDGVAIQTQWQLAHRFEDTKREKVLVIAGPTASGKTALSMQIAPKLNGEIVSADSMQVYRGMDIGTAKASRLEQETVLHHLLDVRDLKDPITVVDYYYLAREAIKSILARNKVPIVVGGSGFYIHTLLYGPPPGPPSVRELRERLEGEAEKFGIEALYHRLKQLDPEYAKTVTCCDRQKVIRALEIITLSEKKVSDLQWRRANRPLEYDYACWFVHRPRNCLYERIEERCDAMLAQGLVDEVRVLRELGLEKNPSAAAAIGYRQVLDFLDKDCTADGFEELKRHLKTATRRYAKRQLTWFRRETLFRWLDLGLHDLETAADMIIQDFDARL